MQTRVFCARGGSRSMSPGQPERAGQFLAHGGGPQRREPAHVIGELLPRRDGKLIIRQRWQSPYAVSSA